VFILNRGLKNYDALFVAPMYQAMLVFVGALSGVFFFDELEVLETDMRILFGGS